MVVTPASPRVYGTDAAFLVRVTPPIACLPTNKRHINVMYVRTAGSYQINRTQQLHRHLALRTVAAGLVSTFIDS